MVKNKTTSGDGIYPYYLKNGKLRYEAYAFNGVDKGTGKQSKKHKKGFHTYADAKKWKKVTEGEFADEEYIHHNPSRVKIKDYLNEWLNVYKPNLKLGAKINYRQTIDFYVIPYIGNYVLSEYNTRTHQKYINSLMCDKNIGKDNNGLSLGSVKKVHDLISSAFNQAIALGILKNNPAKGVSFPKKKQDDTLHYFTYQETEIFLEEARNQKDPAWYPIFLTIFDQGLRKGETLGLEWKDIDFSKWTYVVDDPKTISSIRDLPMTNRMKQALLSYRNYVIGIFGHLPYTGENQFIFLKTAYNNEIGTPFRGQAINPAMNRIIESQDLPKIKVHDGRHTYAVRLREAGVSLDDIGELLGHTDAKTTRIYAHITPEIKERAVDKLETYLISKQNASVH